MNKVVNDLTGKTWLHERGHQDAKTLSDGGNDALPGCRHNGFGSRIREYPLQRLLRSGIRAADNENAALTAKVSIDDLKDIYSGKKSVFDNGTKIQPARLSGAADEAFIGTVFERSVSRYEEILKKILFSGTAVPPKVISSEEQMLQHVKAHTGAIGVVSKAGLPGVRYLEIQD
jgi:hypothetical protein